MKHYIQQHHDIELTQQSTNLELEQNLAGQIFTEKPKRSWLVGWPWPIGLSLMGTAAVVGAMYITHNNVLPVQTAINNVTHELVDPKMALAESLEYTFGKDSFVQSFGLGNPNEFRYRKIVVTAPHQRRMPLTGNTVDQGTVYRDDEYEKLRQQWPEYTFSATLDVWAYQGSARLDEVNFASDQPDRKYYNHDFISQFDQRYCYSEIGIDQGDKITERCPTISTEAKQRTENYLQAAALVPFSKNIDKDFALKAETEPSVRTVDLTDHVLNYPTVNVRFATKEPIQSNTKIAYYSQSNIGGSDQLYNDSTYSGYYRNKLEGDLYWHSTSEDQGLDSTGVFYIQFIEGSRATPIYEYHAADHSLTPLDYDTFVQHVQTTILQENFMQGLYQSYLMPALYLMKHFDDLGEPLEQANELKNDHATTRLRFQLPDSYYAEVNSGFGDDMPSDSEYIDVWFDSQANQIIAYNLLDKNMEMISSVEIQENDVVTAIPPEQFFSFEYWKQAVGLKDEHITDEPLIMKRSENSGG